jgi:hypothetical protein
MWRKAIPRERLPLDKVTHFKAVATEETNLSLELISLPRVVCQHEKWGIQFAAEFRRGQRGTGADQTAPAATASR